MRNRSIIIISIFTLFLAVSCKKDDNGGGNTGPESPTDVTIDAPTPNAIILNGTTLRIEGTAIDNNILTTVKVEIKNKTSGAVLFTNSVTTPNVTLYRFLWNWPVNGISSSFTATVKVTGRDIRGNEGFKEVDIKLEP